MEKLIAGINAPHCFKNRNRICNCPLADYDERTKAVTPTYLKALNHFGSPTEVLRQSVTVQKDYYSYIRNRLSTLCLDK